MMVLLARKAATGVSPVTEWEEGQRERKNQEGLKDEVVVAHGRGCSGGSPCPESGGRPLNGSGRREPSVIGEGGLTQAPRSGDHPRSRRTGKGIPLPLLRHSLFGHLMGFWADSFSTGSYRTKRQGQVKQGSQTHPKDHFMPGRVRQ